MAQRVIPVRRKLASILPEVMDIEDREDSRKIAERIAKRNRVRKAAESHDAPKTFGIRSMTGVVRNASAPLDIDGARKTLEGALKTAGLRNANIFFQRVIHGERPSFEFHVEFPGQWTQHKYCQVTVYPGSHPTHFEFERDRFPLSPEGVESLGNKLKMASIAAPSIFVVHSREGGEGTYRVLGEYTNGEEVLKALRRSGFNVQQRHLHEIGKCAEIVCLPMYYKQAQAVCQNVGNPVNKQAQIDASSALNEIRQKQQELQALLDSIAQQVEDAKKAVEEEIISQPVSFEGQTYSYDEVKQMHADLLKQIEEAVRNVRGKVLRWSDGSYTLLSTSVRVNYSYKDILEYLKVALGKLEGFVRALNKAMNMYATATVSYTLKDVMTDQELAKARALSQKNDAKVEEARANEWTIVEKESADLSTDEVAAASALLGTLVSISNGLDELINGLYDFNATPVTAAKKKNLTPELRIAGHSAYYFPQDMSLEEVRDKVRAMINKSNIPPDRKKALQWEAIACRTVDELEDLVNGRLLPVTKRKQVSDERRPKGAAVKKTMASRRSLGVGGTTR